MTRNFGQQLKQFGCPREGECPKVSSNAPAPAAVFCPAGELHLRFPCGPEDQAVAAVLTIGISLRAGTRGNVGSGGLKRCVLGSIPNILTYGRDAVHPLLWAGCESKFDALGG